MPSVFSLPPNVLRRPQSLIQLQRWVVLRSQVRFQLKQVMLRVSHCLDRLFELIRSGGSQLVLFQVFSRAHVPPPCPKLDFQSGRCPIASSVRFEVEELSLSPQARAPYLLQRRTIVSIGQTLLITLFIGVKRQVKTNPILPRLHLTWDTSPRPAVLNYTTSGKFPDFQLFF